MATRTDDPAVYLLVLCNAIGTSHSAAYCERTVLHMVDTARVPHTGHLGLRVWWTSRGFHGAWTYRVVGRVPYGVGLVLIEGTPTHEPKTPQVCLLVPHQLQHMIPASETLNPSPLTLFDCTISLSTTCQPYIRHIRMYARPAYPLYALLHFKARVARDTGCSRGESRWPMSFGGHVQRCMRAFVWYLCSAA
jgi:hypothetical protein